MDIENYIQQAIFQENEQHRTFYELIWENFKEDGFVITDEENHEIDAIIKATALQNLVGEFIYRLYDEVNETGFEDALEYLQNLGFDENDITEYCENNDSIEVDEDDFEITLKNALDYTTEIVADKMLEEFSADDIFDFMFTVTYSFEQDFTFDFEDYEEMQAFIDTNHEQLDNYKEEYPSVMRWVESGMIC
ncbi:MAG: hypothetical protein K2H13_09125 [Eubacterium sp.]|nr:hypothetical protein [Eubacterium sp.]MDE6154841.1 hypothetical protein [Eubacterium sp.]